MTLVLVAYQELLGILVRKNWGQLVECGLCLGNFKQGRRESSSGLAAVKKVRA